jgi:hypothetical protein
MQVSTYLTEFLLAMGIPVGNRNSNAPLTTSEEPLPPAAESLCIAIEMLLSVVGAHNAEWSQEKERLENSARDAATRADVLASELQIQVATNKRMKNDIESLQGHLEEATHSHHQQLQGLQREETKRQQEWKSSYTAAIQQLADKRVKQAAEQAEAAYKRTLTVIETRIEEEVGRAVARAEASAEEVSAHIPYATGAVTTRVALHVELRTCAGAGACGRSGRVCTRCAQTCRGSPGGRSTNGRGTNPRVPTTGSCGERCRALAIRGSRGK